MDVQELTEWMAYDLSQDKDFKEKTLRENNLQHQRQQTKDQEAARVLEFFRGMQRNV